MYLLVFFLESLGYFKLLNYFKKILTLYRLSTIYDELASSLFFIYDLLCYIEWDLFNGGCFKDYYRIIIHIVRNNLKSNTNASKLSLKHISLIWIVFFLYNN